MNDDALLVPLRDRLAPFGQDHVLRWWPELEPAQRQRLADQIEHLDLPLLQSLLAAGDEKPSSLAITPPPVLHPPETMDEWEATERSRARGEEALRRGQVAVCLVAGGQGTRLGHPGPKGTCSVGPVTARTLFQIHAQKVLALGRRHETPLLFCIMTGPENDEATRQYFAEHAYFGLDTAQVWFFMQGTMPAVDAATGKLLLADRGEIAASPDGHGGVLRALEASGCLAELEGRGVRHLFYFQVDNPLVQVGDPAFLGAHIEAGAEMSLKVVSKLRPDEKLGVAVVRGGKTCILEYTELPPEQAAQRHPDGALIFDAGSIAVHILEVPFLRRLVSGPERLPFHRALKKVSYMDDQGSLIQPAQPNALKFEMFIFDALPLARKTLVMATNRAEEFEPLKNATGENSPATVRQAMTSLYAEWLRQAGVDVERGADGRPRHAIEISPLVALDAAELRGKLRAYVAPDGPLLLESDPPYKETDTEEEE